MHAYSVVHTPYRSFCWLLFGEMGMVNEEDDSTSYSFVHVYICTDYPSKHGAGKEFEVSKFQYMGVRKFCVCATWSHNLRQG
jgi:hypothetical protein